MNCDHEGIMDRACKDCPKCPFCGTIRECTKCKTSRLRDTPLPLTIPDTFKPDPYLLEYYLSLKRDTYLPPYLPEPATTSLSLKRKQWNN